MTMFVFCVYDFFEYLLECWFRGNELLYFLFIMEAFISHSIMSTSFAG
jgi:hypothetical protein